MTEEVSRTDIVLPGSVDENYWPGPPYSPTVFEGGFPHGNQAHPHDFYHSVMGPWYEYQKVAGAFHNPKGYDWVRIDSGEADWRPPEETTW
jgi:hypothetical protein